MIYKCGIFTIADYQHELTCDRAIQKLQQVASEVIQLCNALSSENSLLRTETAALKARIAELKHDREIKRMGGGA